MVNNAVLLSVGRLCNSNCCFCEDLLVKASYEKSLAEIKSGLDSLRSASDIITLPCNSDCRKDFFEILDYAKSLGFLINLQTNARMFLYKDFSSKAAKYLDSVSVIFCKDFVAQTVDGARNICGMVKKFELLVPVNRWNANTLADSCSRASVFGKPQVLVAGPHPLVYLEIDRLKPFVTSDVPYEVKFELTAKCNKNCEFCFNSNTFSRDVDDMPTGRVLEIISKIADFGVKRVRFTGGEPFLRKDFLDILRHSRGLGLHVWVNTNGTLLNNICALKGLVDQVLLPLHSLDCANEQLHLAARLDEQGIAVMLNTVLTSDNIKRLDEYVRLMKGFDWFLARPVPTKKDPMPITCEDVGLLIEKLVSLDPSISRIHIDSLPFCSYDPKKVKLFSRGAAGCGVFNKLVVGPDGNLKPCYSVSKNLGTIDDLQHAWQNSLSSQFRHLECFPLICRQCTYLYDCLGGCRFAAKLANGSYDSMDPLAKPEVFL